MKIVPSIWLIISILFLCFGVYHYDQSKQTYPLFQWTSLDSRGIEFGFYNFSAIETRHNFENFANQWNTYIDDQNRKSHAVNRIAAITYFISSFMALIAMLIPGPYNIKNTICCLYKKCIQASALKRFLRQTKSDVKKQKG